MPSRNRPPGRPPHPDMLTPAEWRVVEAVRHGLSNPDIARRLGVSPDAVKFHVANALQKLAFTSRRQLRQWPGITRASSLAHQDHAMTQATPLGPIGQIARTVSNIDAARAWYGEALGLEHLFSFGKLALFNCGGVRLFLSEGEAVTADSILYFSVADIHATQAQLAARGIAFTNAPHMIHRHADGTEEWMAFFQDNENRPLALMSQIPLLPPPISK